MNTELATGESEKENCDLAKLSFAKFNPFKA
jgi:hypothetical protein